VTTFVRFLRERLEDDEAYARNAFGDHNDAEASWSEIWSGTVQLGSNEDLLATGDSQVSRHIVRHDPARVLAEVGARRRMLELHTACDDWSFGQPCEEARLLALPYSDHPDYDDSWKPEC
jgi:hypothetical protein